jgi:hypothetical protein
MDAIDETTVVFLVRPEVWVTFVCGEFAGTFDNREEAIFMMAEYGWPYNHMGEEYATRH